jgi:hypothetical protein
MFKHRIDLNAKRLVEITMQVGRREEIEKGRCFKD